MPQVRANLVIGSNGMSTLAGSSRGLSSPADREKFQQLRRESDVILIGGSTYRNEPYSKCPLPLYVSTRAYHAISTKVSFFNLSPAELVKKAKSDGYKEILIEGGVSFLSELIANSLIDEFHLTRSLHFGDQHFFDEVDLKKNYNLITRSNLGPDCFEIWEKIIPQQ
jgi:riboflavin biosynthesis pyrimidine reductase